PSTPSNTDFAPTPDAPRWNLLQRVGFRFLFTYFLLFILPFPFNRFQPLDPVASRYDKAESAVVTWTAKHVLRIEKPVVQLFNGSGDTTFDYVLTLCILAVAVAITLIWSAFASRNARYIFLHDFLRTCVRFYLGYVLCSYGMDKVFPMQFA